MQKCDKSFRSPDVKAVKVKQKNGKMVEVANDF
jgi:hypothetical protein